MVRAGVRGAGEGRVLAPREGGGDVDDGKGTWLRVWRFGGEGGEIVEAGDVVC